MRTQMNLLFKISYGLFVLCAKAGKEESGCIINTFLQQTSVPETFSITVNKRNFSHDPVEQSGECVVCCRFEMQKKICCRFVAIITQILGKIDERIRYYSMRVTAEPGL